MRHSQGIELLCGLVFSAPSLRPPSGSLCSQVAVNYWCQEHVRFLSPLYASSSLPHSIFPHKNPHYEQPCGDTVVDTVVIDLNTLPDKLLRRTTRDYPNTSQSFLPFPNLFRLHRHSSSTTINHDSLTLVFSHSYTKNKCD